MMTDAPDEKENKARSLKRRQANLVTEEVKTQQVL